MVATHISDGNKIKFTGTNTTNGNYPQKILINRLIPEIIPFVIPLDPRIADGVATSSGMFHAHQTISSKEIVMDTARSGASIFKDLKVVNWRDTEGIIQREGNNVVMVERLTNPVMIGAGTSVSPNRTGMQDIGSPNGSFGSKEVMDAQPLETSINGIYDKHRDPVPTFSKVIFIKLSNESSTNVYLRCRMNLMRDAVLTESPNFRNLGLLSVHTSDEFGYVFTPTTIIRRLEDRSNWILPDHFIGEVTTDRLSRTISEKNYSAKTDFETRRENQCFGRQNSSMSRPPLDSTTLGTNTNNVTTSPIESIPVGTKTTEPMQLKPPTYFPTLPKDLSEKNGKAHVPGDLYPDPP